MPRYPEEYATWMGHIKSPGEVRDSYQVDNVFYIDEIGHKLREIQSSPVLLLLKGTNTDSGKETLVANFEGISKFDTNETILHHEICELRYDIILEIIVSFGQLLS